MPLIVDGYNLLFAIQETIDPIQESRDEVIDFINSITTNVTLLFDSSYEHAEHYAQTKHLTNISIEFSPAGLSADEYILEKLRFEKRPADFLIVTSDKRLAREIRELGAKTQSIKVFLQSLRKKRPLERKREKESPAEIHRLLTIFTQKLDANDEK